MQKRKLGNSGLEVSALGFGCMGLNFLDGKGLDKKDNRLKTDYIDKCYNYSKKCYDRPIIIGLALSSKALDNTNTGDYKIASFSRKYGQYKYSINIR